MHSKLRPYQQEIKAQTYAAWNEGHRNVLLVMPTGMGKTRTFCCVAAEMAVDASGPRHPTAIMVHRKELVSQISLTLSEEGIAHNIIAPRNVILGIIAAQRQQFKKQFYDFKAPITVVSVDTLNARASTYEKWAQSIRFWITDEAAHVLAKNKWGRALSIFPNAIGLGVTATPRRLDKRGLGRHADGVFDTMVEGPGTRWGIRNGFLSKYKIAVPAGDYQNYLKRASEGSDFTREAMATASSQSHIVGDAVKNYEKFASGKQAIYFCSDIASGQKMEEKFKETGISAKLLTGDTEDKIRLSAMQDFRDKRINVLLNVDLFDEGLDVPGIEVVGMCRPTMSVGKYLQMIGRGLRVIKGKDHCIIIDHVGNVQEHGLPDTVRPWTLDRIVKRQDKTNTIRICQNHLCNAPYDRVLTECPYCGFKIQKPIPGEGGGKIGPKEVDGDLQLLDESTLREMYESATLEDPGSVGRRVSKVAGAAAGIKAMNQQAERIAKANELSEVIATWAGKQKDFGYTDRQIHKKFFLEFDMTISYALSQPRAEMDETLNELKDRFRL